MCFHGIPTINHLRRSRRRRRAGHSHMPTPPANTGKKRGCRRTGRAGEATVCSRARVRHIPSMHASCVRANCEGGRPQQGHPRLQPPSRRTQRPACMRQLACPLHRPTVYSNCCSAGYRASGSPPVNVTLHARHKQQKCAPHMSARGQPCPSLSTSTSGLLDGPRHALGVRLGDKAGHTVAREPWSHHSRTLTTEYTCWGGTGCPPQLRRALWGVGSGGAQPHRTHQHAAARLWGACHRSILLQWLVASPGHQHPTLLAAREASVAKRACNGLFNTQRRWQGAEERILSDWSAPHLPGSVAAAAPRRCRTRSRGPGS